MKSGELRLNFYKFNIQANKSTKRILIIFFENEQGVPDIDNIWTLISATYLKLHTHYLPQSWCRLASSKLWFDPVNITLLTDLKIKQRPEETAEVGILEF